MLLVVADVVGLVVMATVVVTVAVVREGMIVVGSKVLGTSGEWKKTKYKTKSYHANKRQTQMIQITKIHTSYLGLTLTSFNKIIRYKAGCTSQFLPFFVHFHFMLLHKVKTRSNV